jgi:hypothetical protein
MITQPTFDKKLSLELDKAVIAIEQAQAAGDKVREQYAREWKRRLEKKIFGGSDE